jgi:hypothetical protein
VLRADLDAARNPSGEEVSGDRRLRSADHPRQIPHRRRATTHTPDRDLEYGGSGFLHLQKPAGFRSFRVPSDPNFTPRGKGGGHGLARDCYHEKPPPPEEFARDLAALWILLPPKHFYGTTLEISREDYNRELEEPGRYRLTGEYDSEGLMSGINCNATSYFPDQVAKLRNKAWVGKIQSTPVTIQVVKAKPAHSASSASR